MKLQIVFIFLIFFCLTYTFPVQASREDCINECNKVLLRQDYGLIDGNRKKLIKTPGKQRVLREVRAYPSKAVVNLLCP